MVLRMKNFNIFGVHWKIQLFGGGGGGGLQQINHYYKVNSNPANPTEMVLAFLNSKSNSHKISPNPVRWCKYLLNKTNI